MQNSDSMSRLNPTQALPRDDPERQPIRRRTGSWTVVQDPIDQSDCTNGLSALQLFRSLPLRSQHRINSSSEHLCKHQRAFQNNGSFRLHSRVSDGILGGRRWHSQSPRAPCDLQSIRGPLVRPPFHSSSSFVLYSIAPIALDSNYHLSEPPNCRPSTCSRLRP